MLETASGTPHTLTRCKWWKRRKVVYDIAYLATEAMPQYTYREIGAETDNVTHVEGEAAKLYACTHYTVHRPDRQTRRGFKTQLTRR